MTGIHEDIKHVRIHPLYAARFRKIARKASVSEYATRVTPENPWVCFSNEFGVSELSAAGGLGYLAGDWVLLAGKLGIPFVGIGLYYSYKWKQDIDAEFWQAERFYKTPEPEFYAFRKVPVHLPQYRSNGDRTTIDLYRKDVQGNLLLMLEEPGIRALYEGHKQEEHRLYQSAVLGFMGFQALSKLGITPSILHLNESTTVFAAIVWVDTLISEGKSLEAALRIVREYTIFTNHTLSPAAEPVWSIEHITRYVLGNIKNKALLDWIHSLLEEEPKGLRLSTLAFAVAGKINAVSTFHAVKATDSYSRPFTPITNAIATRWIYPEIMHAYRKLKIGDPIIDSLPPDFVSKLTRLKTTDMREIKQRAKDDLCAYLLSERKDQYGNPVSIPEDATIAVWARRIDSYKRPGLLFTSPKTLARILKKHNMHIIFSGKAHQSDRTMKLFLQSLLRKIDRNPVLKNRVHFVQDYNWQLAKYMGGADIILNTPIPGWEACGTSWEKAVANWLLLCSTRDGGASDIFFTNQAYQSSPPYYEITGDTDKAAAISLYDNLDRMGQVLSKPVAWRRAVVRQLEAFLPIISGTRMMLEYLSFRFGTQVSADTNDGT